MASDGERREQALIGGRQGPVVVDGQRLATLERAVISAGGREANPGVGRLILKPPLDARDQAAR